MKPDQAGDCGKEDEKLRKHLKIHWQVSVRNTLDDLPNFAQDSWGGKYGH